MIFSFPQLQTLWTQANPDLSSYAPLMAAIGLAESSGIAGNYNPTDNGGRQTSWGLWQVSDGTHNAPQNWDDPFTNARLAGEKLRSQGLTAWGTYTSGVWKKFFGGGALPAADVATQSVPQSAPQSAAIPAFSPAPLPKSLALTIIMVVAIPLAIIGAAGMAGKAA